jgi:S1-C subfamily serine protease
MKVLGTLVVALLLVGGAVACDDEKASSPSSAGLTAARTETATSPQSVSQSPGASSQDRPADQSENATDVVVKVWESVVRIRAGGQRQSGPSGTTPAPEGTGTGFVIDERGYIVTNNHVVSLGTDQPAATLEVQLWNGKSLPAKLVGRDVRTDLAVIKVDGERLKPLRFAEPESIFIGEEVLAIGFALDLGAEPTVTKGVVSAEDRVISETIQVAGRPVEIDISGAIQTDAAINPGNSGGPLVDLAGDVVGVNTAGLTGTADVPVQGIFFAVASQIAEPITRVLIEKGNVERGFLGIRAATVNRQIAQASNLPVNDGARIVSVESGSAADRAGLQQGDVITKIGEVEIDNVGDISSALFRYAPGTAVQVEYVRNGQTRTTQVTPTARPESSL